MNELTLKVKQNPGTIELNFDELNKQMELRLAEYKGAVFTEDSKDIAKGELASLRRLKKDVEDARKLAKKEWCKPLDIFEGKMKELSSKVDEPIELIGEQLDAFELDRRAKKREVIEGIYTESIGDMAEYLTLDKIYNPKWENATTSVKSIRDEITATVTETRVAVQTIAAMESDATDKALSMYKDTLDLPKSMAHITEYEQRKIEILRKEEEKRKQEEERQRQAEIDRARAAEREAIKREEEIRQEALQQATKQVQKETVVTAEVSYPSVEDDTDLLPFEQPSTVTVFYKVVATPAELDEVETVFNSFGIYFDRRNA